MSDGINTKTVSVPLHVGVIMDGNGRWAQRRGQIRTQGHLEGLKAAKRVVKAASDLGISYLTLYTFSTENWKRAADEVGFIMGLVKQYLRGELAFYRENHIRIRHAGNKEGLPEDIRGELEAACRDTAAFNGLQVILALNYGGRDEIARAFKRMIREEPGIGTTEDVTPELIGLYLDNPDIPDPDLIIRTAGEFRTSNFLLWEGAYAEYYISDKLWPDWGAEDLLQAVDTYTGRNRRFGGIAES
ncbi:MAG: di-trans,poly-cis-decaprenylcistransferase [Treponema sp.]|jgi:undecaprenyl diphosphate synthase|nr:di-trans,poly-cis-decaprenylcistransferase [Treponema sp.]